MPIHLPQLTRRDFLKRAALAGVAAVLAPSALAKTRDEDMLAFFSDTHIAADPAEISRHVNMADHLAATVRDFSAWPVSPAAVIVNGDLALKEGLPGDYATFGKLIDPVRALAPIHLSLGNHDERQHFWSAFPADAAKTAEAALQRQVAVFATARANWYLLDSLDQTNVSDGLLGSVQLAWLATELAARPAKPAVVVVHHNPSTSTEKAGLKDVDALLEVLASHRQVKACVFGHTHDWHVETHASGVHLINLPPTGYVFKDGRPSGWVRATLTDDGAEFELRALDRTHPEHGQIKKLAWRTA